MFDVNPKGFNLLKEDLAVSGIEMSFDPVSAGLAIFSAGSSIIGGIAGADQAGKNQRAAEKASRQQAKAINRYNERKFKNDKFNFEQQRKYNYEIAMKQYEYNTQIQDLKFDTSVRAYNKDQQNYTNQLEFNNIALRQAYMREQNVMRDLTAEQSFKRQNTYVDSLKAKSKASLGQAGASTDRAIGMALAEKGRQLAVADASFSGAIRESTINMFDIAMNKMGADMRAEAATMLKPVNPIPLVKPTLPPMPRFTEPNEVSPGFVPQTSATATILSGISSAAGALAGVDWTNANKFTPAPGGGGFGSSSFDLNNGSPFAAGANNGSWISW